MDVTIGEDNPAVRDFLSMLPLTITVEEFAGREKISYLPRKLRHRGSPGSDPESGDLIYFVPWGNLGFYYNAEGIGYSDDTIHLGTYDATLDELERLEGEVTVEIIDLRTADALVLGVPEWHVEGSGRRLYIFEIVIRGSGAGTRVGALRAVRNRRDSRQRAGGRES